MTTKQDPFQVVARTYAKDLPVIRKLSIQVSTAEGLGIIPNVGSKSVVFFDLDHCVYSRAHKLGELMDENTQRYFKKHNINPKLANKYYHDYGLEIYGLILHHPEVDVSNFNDHCDGSLPLKDRLVVRFDLQKLFAEIDRRKYQVWGLTNAFISHGVNVLKYTGLAELFDGLVSCDYGNTENFSCKPHKQYFEDALRALNINADKAFFVDDSPINIINAHWMGFANCVLYDEEGDKESIFDELLKDGESRQRRAFKYGSVHVVRDLVDLKSIWPQVFSRHQATDGH